MERAIDHGSQHSRVIIDVYRSSPVASVHVSIDEQREALRFEKQFKREAKQLTQEEVSQAAMSADSRGSEHCQIASSIGLQKGNMRFKWREVLE